MQEEDEPRGRIYNIRDLSKEKKGGLLGSQKSWEFTSSDEESFSPMVQGRLILCSQLLFDYRLFPNKPSPHQSPTFGPTLYKFIVMGPLGLNPVRCWVRSEHRDPTIGVVCGESCPCDDECNDLLRQDQVSYGRLWWLVYCTTGENCQVVYCSTGLWHHVRGSRPHQGSDPRESSGWPRWAPIEESGGRPKYFKGAPRWDQFWKISIGVF